MNEPPTSSACLVSKPVATSLTGSIVVPGDKSISHRCALFGLLASDTLRVDGFLEADDTLATLRAVQSLGAQVEGSGRGSFEITGGDIIAPALSLDMGNSGTGMRLLAGILAGQPFTSELRGDASLSSRPMGRITRPLEQMGARIESATGARPPLRITGSRPLRAIDYKAEVASAQVKSCVLLAGMHARGETRFKEPSPSRDHSERLFRRLGRPVSTAKDGALVIRGEGALGGAELRVPGDPSAAAFHMVAATLVPGSDVLLRNVGLNPLRVGIIDVLRRMGANVDVAQVTETDWEPRADVRVRHAPLRGISIGAADVPAMIDEFPVLFVAAAMAAGETRVHGAAELRVKESDRIAVMAAALRQLNVEVEELPDGIIIQGASIGSGRVQAQGDHRCAMALLVAGAVASGSVSVAGCEGIPTSYPAFATDSRALGMDVVAESP